MFLFGMNGPIMMVIWEEFTEQWTDWKKTDGGSINQIEEVIESLKKNP